MLSKSRIVGKIIMNDRQFETLNSNNIGLIASDNPAFGDYETLIDRIGDAESIICNISTPITAKVLAHCRPLRFIQSWSTGLDHIDVKHAHQMGVKVSAVPDYSSQSIAEKTIGMMIFLAGKMLEAHFNVKQGDWNYTGFQGVELYGKTLVVIGMGKIGSRVAQIAKAFNMRILSVHSKTSTDSLYKALSKADFVSVHCPLNEKTHYLFDEKAFVALKPGAIFINNSRGGVVDEKAMMLALDRGLISYAAVDVLEEEPPSPDNPMIHHPQIFVTPHMTWNTKESVERLTQSCIDNLLAHHCISAE